MGQHLDQTTNISPAFPIFSCTDAIAEKIK